MNVFDIMMKYSGITAIIIYSLLLFVILKLSSRKPKLREPQDDQPDIPETRKPLDPDDELAVVASLVASIDYHNETGKNIRVISVTEVK